MRVSHAQLSDIVSTSEFDMNLTKYRGQTIQSLENQFEEKNISFFPSMHTHSHNEMRMRAIRKCTKANKRIPNEIKI